MRIFLATTLALLAALSTPTTAQEIAAGSRVIITSDWHSKNGGAYKPKVITCKSKSGLCLRDTSYTPANNPMIQAEGGLQVIFKKHGIIYLFKKRGQGTFLNMKGAKVGKFKWSQ